jgi:ribonuclease Z
MISLKGYKSLKLSGYSRAAHRTGIEIIGLNILLDAGLDVQKAFSHIFITHQHLDHVIYLPQYTMNIENDKQYINVISTNNILNNIKPYLCEALKMSKNINGDNYVDILKKVNTNFIPIDNNNCYKFCNGREQWLVNHIKCYHGIDSIGFGFSVIKNKLKEEYNNLTNQEIIKLKNEGQSLTNEIKEDIFLFLGDTNKKILQNKDIYKYKSIIIECTYIYDEELDLAKINKHIHWLDIKNIIIENKDIQFILIHFSMKYKNQDIKDFFNKENLTNIDIFI